jgi:hypothetical protein
MALSPVRSDLHPPCFSKTYVLPVAGASSLHEKSGGALMNHLPSSVFLIVSTTGTFVWTDAGGNSNTMTLAVGDRTLPFVPATIEVGTAIGEAVVSWNPEP